MCEVAELEKKSNRLLARLEGREPLTGVARLAVDALLGSVADGPVSVHEEAVTQRVTEPLHGWRDAATGRQAGLAGAAQEHPL